MMGTPIQAQTTYQESYNNSRLEITCLVVQISLFINSWFIRYLCLHFSKVLEKAQVSHNKNKYLFYSEVAKLTNSSIWCLFTCQTYNWLFYSKRYYSFYLETWKNVNKDI